MSEYKLYHGDCLTVFPQITPNSIDLVVTDPPYYAYIEDSWDNQWDSFEDFVNWFSEILDNIYKALKDNGSAYVFTGINYEFNKLVDVIYSSKFTVQNMILWYRESPGSGESKRFNINYEIIWFLTKGKDYKFNLDDVRIKPWHDDSRNNPKGKNPGSIWYIPNIMLGRNKEQVGHPTQKPEELIQKMILASSNKDDVVLDPFMGSGTTLKVCQDNGRSCTGVELDNSYIDIIKKRVWGRQFLDRTVKYEFIIVVDEL